jgi:hypothetical protein
MMNAWLCVFVMSGSIGLCWTSVFVWAESGNLGGPQAHKSASRSLDQRRGRGERDAVVSGDGLKDVLMRVFEDELNVSRM